MFVANASKYMFGNKCFVFTIFLSLYFNGYSCTVEGDTFMKKDGGDAWIAHKLIFQIMFNVSLVLLVGLMIILYKTFPDNLICTNKYHRQ